MITAIEIENFKGFSHRQRIELRPLTLLYGANSAGKSSVFDAIHYVREVIERSNLDAQQVIGGGDMVDLGGFDTMVHNHTPGTVIKLRIDIGFLPPGFSASLLASEDDPQVVSWIANRARDGWIEFHVVRNGPPIVSHYEMGLNGSRLLASDTSADGSQATLTMDADHSIFRLPDSASNDVPPFIQELIKRFEGNESSMPSNLIRLFLTAEDDMPAPLPPLLEGQVWTVAGDALPRTNSAELIRLKQAMAEMPENNSGRVVLGARFEISSGATFAAPTGSKPRWLSRSGPKEAWAWILD